MYKKITNSLLSTPSLINRICEIGVFVKNKAGLLGRDESGLHKDMSIYIVTSLVYINSANLKSDYEKVFKILKKYSDIELKKNPRLNTGKIFKSDVAWLEIKKELDTRRK